MRAFLIVAAVAALLTTNSAAETTSPAADGWIASPRGVNVHVDASSNSRVVAVLWSGARVFVRENNGDFVRIDGYGVSGYGYIKRAYVSDAPPAAPQSTEHSQDVQAQSSDHP